MDDSEKMTVTTTSREVQALLTILRRIPMTDLEALAIEGIFGRWFEEINDQTNQLRALERIEELSRSNGVGAGVAAGDVLTGEDKPEAAPDFASDALTNGTASRLAG